MGAGKIITSSIVFVLAVATAMPAAAVHKTTRYKRAHYRHVKSWTQDGSDRWPRICRRRRHSSASAGIQLNDHLPTPTISVAGR